MKIIKINLNKITRAEVNLIADYLKRGKVIAYPTDTVYGLGCDARNAKAIKKVNKIKGQKGIKPLLVLISDFKMLKKYCLVNSAQMGYLKKIWTRPHPSLSLARRGAVRPITVILKRKVNLPDELTGGLNSLAVRLPKSEFLVKIISDAGFPIVSTSLNKVGDKLLTNVKNLKKYFKYLPDLAIDAGIIKGRPSKLIDLRDVKNIKVIRK